MSLTHICGTVLWVASSLPGQDATTDIANRVGTLVESRFPGTHCPGLSVAVAENNRIVYSRAFGFADLEQNVPLRVDSVHRLASVSKVVTGTIVMDLVQRGRLNLDSPVHAYLPELSPSYRDVTVMHLLTHQAGVRGYRDIEEVFSTAHYATSREAMKSFAADPLLFAPGARVEYSTFGFTLLGATAEAVTGKSFQELSRDFFVRHAIQGFDIDDARAIVRQRVRGYFIDSGGTPHNARFYDASNKYPAGGFTASAENSLRFAIAVGIGHVLNPEILRRTWTPQITAQGEKTPFGLGWGVTERHGRKMVGFNGLQPMTETSLRYFPETGAGIALFCNAEGAKGIPELMDSLTEIVLAEGARY